MAELSLYQALTIFAWFPLAFTLAVLLLIARFYERFSAARTYWPLFAVPIFGYAAAHVREAAMGTPGDPLADALQMVSGVVLLALMVRLTVLMLRHRQVVASVSPLVLLLGGTLGAVGLSVGLFMFARYTRRMVILNRQPAYHRAYYLAALGMGLAAIFRLFAADVGMTARLLYPALVAASMTVAAVVSWRSWSWLLAERA